MLKRKAFIVVLAIIFVVGCTSFAGNAYKALYVTAQAYDAGMKSVAELQKDGIITEEQRAEINIHATKVYHSYQAASAALSVYNKTKTSEDKDRLVIILSELMTNWMVYAEAVNSFAPNTIPVEVK